MTFNNSSLNKQAERNQKMNNFPLRRMIKQLVLEGEINYKEGEIFKIFEDLPFNPTLEIKKDCLDEIKKGNLKKEKIKEKKWEQLGKIVKYPKERRIILEKSLLFDKSIEKMTLKKGTIMSQIHVLILKEVLRTLKK